MTPPPAALSSGTARRAHRNWPVRSTSRQRRQSAGVDLLDRCGRAGDPGIVDQNVEPAQPRAHLVEQTVDIGLVRNVGQGTRNARQLSPQSGQRRLGDIADVNPRPGLDQRIDHGPTDAGRTRRDQHPLAVRPQLGHAGLPMLMSDARARPGLRPGPRARR